MNASRLLRTALPFAAPLAAVIALPIALTLGAADAHAMDAADTSDRVFALTAGVPGVSHALDGDVVTVFGQVDGPIEKYRLIAAIERLDGVAEVRSTIKTD